MTEQEYKGKKVAFHTLGCKLNFAESSSMARKFEDIGFERVEYKDEADVYVVNTCSVTAESDKKSRNLIRSAMNRNPNAVMIVTGCYAQLKPEDIAHLQGVDYVLGSGEKMNITSYIDNLQKNEEPIIRITDHRKIKNFFSSYSYGDRTRTFLKVQDGCNYFCTFCTIPMARGLSRNDSISNTIDEAKKVVARGTKEIILTGVNIGDFGRSTGETFFDLVKALDEVEGLERIRISSVEPNLLTDEIIEFVAKSKRFMPHFHVPLQAGSDEVLGLMKRKYNTSLFSQRIQKIKSLMPTAFIGVDIIAGTNGETNQLFKDSYNYLLDTNFTQLHVFPYSERLGTFALKIPHVVPVSERKERVKRYIDLSERKHRMFYESQLGKTHKVLFEHQKKGSRMFGWTSNYVRIETEWNEALVNQIVPFKLELINQNNHVEGVLV
ncbi:MAG: tRNA (N(6)-L-threonylcarbamoyladenosine(37)-C(2))-methylthiotransferase MtaB [Prolixibacteraceae bacterium]|jgi:threonylcarbamoyladenosine tRNA methylthiotransferase MtaB|nr:tRNA (N(6)-L-threonylcarbamoyladenosine(37)-C(2))-methylthiotransferase MtaB [Prolixibacteraceae bacterium]